MKQTQIKVCYDCGFPLLWTFFVDGAEYYCLNCGRSTGMLGGGNDVPITPELRARQRIAKDVFKALRKHLFGSGRYKLGRCKKCKTSEYHFQHITQKEVECDRFADELLKRLKTPNQQ